MKNLIIPCTFVLSSFIFSPAVAQTNPDSLTKREPSSPQQKTNTSPATEQSATKQSTQNSKTSKSTSTATSPRHKVKKGSAASPPVDNKIAVSDPGMPAEKPNSSKKERTKPNSTGKSESAISPK